MADQRLHQRPAERVPDLVIDHHVGVVAFPRDPAWRPGAQARTGRIGDDVHPLQEADHHVGAAPAHHRRDIGRRQQAGEDQPVGLIEAGIVALVADPVLADRRDIHQRRIDVRQIGTGGLQQAETQIHLAGVAPVDQVRGHTLGAPAVHRGRQKHDARARLVAESLICPAVRHGRFLAARRRSGRLSATQLQLSGESVAQIYAPGGIGGLHGRGGGRHGPRAPARPGAGHDLRRRSGRPRRGPGRHGQRGSGSPGAGG